MFWNFGAGEAGCVYVSFVQSESIRSSSGEAFVLA